MPLGLHSLHRSVKAKTSKKLMSGADHQPGIECSGSEAGLSNETLTRAVASGGIRQSRQPGVALACSPKPYIRLIITTTLDFDFGRYHEIPSTNILTVEVTCEYSS